MLTEKAKAYFTNMQTNREAEIIARANMIIQTRQVFGSNEYTDAICKLTSSIAFITARFYANTREIMEKGGI